MPPRFRNFLLAALFLLLSIGFFQQATFAQQEAIIWSEPLFLGNGWWQSITVDRTGAAHVGWHGSIQEEVDGETVYVDVMDYTRRSPDGQWTTPLDVIYTTDGGYTLRNALGVSSYGRLHAFVRARTNHAYTSAPAMEADKAEAWDPLQIMGGGYYLDLLVDRNDVLHAFSSGSGSGLVEFNDFEASLAEGQESEDCVQCFDLYYYRSADEGRNWSFPQKLNLTKSGTDKVDAWEGVFSGRIYVNWSAGTDWYRGGRGVLDGRFVYSDDGGLTWSSEVILTGEAGTQKEVTQLSVTEMRNDELMAVWHYQVDDDNTIYYQLSQDMGQTWTEPQAIPGIIRRSMTSASLDSYELITDLSGNVHLFANGIGTASGDVSLFHLEYRQGQWSRPETIYLGTDDERPEWPQAAIGPQNDINLTWFVRGRGENDEFNRLLVYYSRRTPTLANRPLLAFEPTVAPTEMIMRTPIPTATPFPTIAPFEMASVNTNNDLYAIETLLAGAAVSLVFCGLILLVSGWRPRR